MSLFLLYYSIELRTIDFVLLEESLDIWNEYAELRTCPNMHNTMQNTARLYFFIFSTRILFIDTCIARMFVCSYAPGVTLCK